MWKPLSNISRSIQVWHLSKELDYDMHYNQNVSEHCWKYMKPQESTYSYRLIVQALKSILCKLWPLEKQQQQQEKKKEGEIFFEKF